MAEALIVELGLILILGVTASWLAWRFHFPSILLLLVTGFLAGPVFGLIQPDALFGDLLLPVVELSVAVILFEGALSLRIIDLEKVGGSVWGLITVGVLTTWFVTVLAAYLLVGLSVRVSFLLGAVLVVTGPTVIIPILRHLRPKGEVGHVLRWEGILIDPIGVILAILTFRVILSGGLEEATTIILLTIGKSLLIDVVMGVGGAMALYFLLRHHFIPDVLQNPVTLAGVLGVFIVAETFQAQSGLAAVTIMGVVLANREDISIRHIMEFKENLRVLFISFVFIVLAARLDLSDLSILGVRSFAFLAALILVARPLAVAVSTWGSSLTGRQKAFLASMAPRGIVAAAMSSVFALRLEDLGIGGAEMLVPLTFLVIVGTVAIYGLTAAPLGRLLGIATPNPQGLMIVGAQPWAREMGERIQEAGLEVLMVDTNPRHLEDAAEEGLRTYHGSTLTDNVLEEIELAGIGHVCALTPNDEVNTLTGLHFLDVFDRSHVYQLPPGEEDPDKAVPQPLRARLLFGPDLGYARLDDLYDEGWTVQRLEQAESPLEPRPSGDVPIPLFRIRASGVLEPYTAGRQPEASPQDDVIMLAPPPEHDPGEGDGRGDPRPTRS